MIRLPALIADRLQWLLPLSDDGVCGLLDGLLADDLDQAASQFTALLAEEPALLLWSVCRSPCWQTDPPNDLREVALWLARHGLSMLHWDDGGASAAGACSSPQLQQWAELAEVAVAVSRLAGKSAGDGTSAWPSLFGLLHNARAWLATSEPALETADVPQDEACLTENLESTNVGVVAFRSANGRSFAERKATLAGPPMPSWLVQWLDDMASPSPRDPTVIAVARAAGMVSQAAGGQNGSAAVGGAGDPAEPRESGLCVKKRWLNSRTEFGSFLPQAIHRLARLRQLEERFDKVLETEKLEALQAFAYGASHEINNPLANISTRAQTLLREEKDPERRRKLAVMNTQAFRAHELIADLMLFARPPALNVSAIDLVELVDQVLGELAADAESQRTALTRLPGVSPVIISADGGHLAAALKSVCVNSLEALRLGGRIEVSVNAAATPPPDSDGGDWAEIVVADTGPGIGPDVRRHLFDPYFSGREAGRGLGLGLTKCWRIVTQHGGQIDVDSGPQPGATFRLRLPTGARP
jgi:signal transduction histidine kinase